MVLDDSVLHHSNPPRTIAMGMGVVLLGLAMGRPAGMTDTAVPRSPVLVHPSSEVDQLPLGTHAMESTIFNGGNTGGVVTAIFQLTQTFKQQG